MSIRDNSGINEVFFIFLTCDSIMSYLRDFILTSLHDIYQIYGVGIFYRILMNLVFLKEDSVSDIWIQNLYIELYTSSFMFGDTLLFWGDFTLVKHLT